MVVAAGVSAAAAGLAWRAKALTGTGALAAWLVGTLVLIGTGWRGGAVLAAFFVSSTLISRGAPAPVVLDPKGDRRDPWQVAANGGVAALVSLAGRQDQTLGLWLLTGALAAAAADTWATAIGSRSRTSPRRLVGWEPVPRGTSGGVTLGGTLGGLAGAALVSITAVLGGAPVALLGIGTLVGFLGMAADSLLGATLQARWHCVVCDRPSEWPVHRCGARTVPRGGLPWLNNDAVNLLASATGALLALAGWGWLCPCA